MAILGGKKWRDTGGKAASASEVNGERRGVIKPTKKKSPKEGGEIPQNNSEKMGLEKKKGRRTQNELTKVK